MQPEGLAAGREQQLHRAVFVFHDQTGDLVLFQHGGGQAGAGQRPAVQHGPGGLATQGLCRAVRAVGKGQQLFVHGNVLRQQEQGQGVFAPDASRQLIAFRQGGLVQTVQQDHAAPGQLARQAQKLQEEMDAVSTQLETTEYSATAGGDAVKAVVTGKMEIKSLEIKPEVVDPDDVEMLSDLVIAAVNEALRAAASDKSERMEKISGGLNMPGLF